MVCVWESWVMEFECFCTSTGSKAPGSSHHGFHLHGQMSSTTTCVAHIFISRPFDQYSWLTSTTFNELDEWHKRSWSQFLKRIQSPSVTWSLNMVYLSDNQKSVFVTIMRVVRPTGIRNDWLTISLKQSCDVVFLSEQQWASSSLQCCPQSWGVWVKALQQQKQTPDTENWVGNLLWNVSWLKIQRLTLNWI